MHTEVHPRFRVEQGGARPSVSIGTELSFLRSEVNYLRSRSQQSASLSAVDLRSALNAQWFRDMVTAIVAEIPAATLPVHYHSELVAPGTSNVTFRVNSNGEYDFIIADMRLRMVLDAATNSRTWYAWDGSAWQEIGDSFGILS